MNKEGDGTLHLAADNYYAGITHIKEGILKMAKALPASLGATGDGNEVVIEAGAALDLNGAYDTSRDDHITVAGAGVNGSGAIFSSSAGTAFNQSFGQLTLAGDTTVSAQNRWDLNSQYPVIGNGFTLTKIGSESIACSRPILNCTIIINEGRITIQNNQTLGGTDYPTYVNNAFLYAHGERATGERIYFTGANPSIGQGADGAAVTYSGHLTVSNQLNISSRIASCIIAISGLIDGPGNLAVTGPGKNFLLNSGNCYQGTTTLNNDRILYVGQLGGAEDGGSLGVGDVTVNIGARLFYDRSGTHTVSNKFNGAGKVIIRNGGNMLLSESVSHDCPNLYICDGTLTLTNNTALTLPTRAVVMADRWTTSGTYDSPPTNMYAVLNVPEGCSITSKYFVCGNDLPDFSGNNITSVVNQSGGVIVSTGSTSEGNGFRMAHYPRARTFWKMSGGTMICQNNYDICMATDGQGWLNVTGGEIYTMRVMLNERDDTTAGYGRFTLAGGKLFLGSPTAAEPELNAIDNDRIETSTYLLELGGLGAEIIAVTDIYIPINATLLGTNCTEAVTFNSSSNTIYFSGLFEGAGGFRKIGSGTMEITSTNSPCGGDICLEEGTLKLNADDAITNMVVYVTEGATLDLGGHDQLIGGVRGDGSIINGTYTATRYFDPGTLMIVF
jgi:autotransporter-associated beta strand protein